MKMRFLVTTVLVFLLLVVSYNPSSYSFTARVLDFMQSPLGWIIIVLFLALWGALLYFVYISTRVVVTIGVFLIIGLLWYNLYHYQSDILFLNQWVSLGIAYSLMAIGIAFCMLWPRIRRGATGVYSTSVVEIPEEELRE